MRCRFNTSALCSKPNAIFDNQYNKNVHELSCKGRPLTAAPAGLSQNPAQKAAAAEAARAGGGGKVPSMFAGGTIMAAPPPAAVAAPAVAPHVAATKRRKRGGEGGEDEEEDEEPWKDCNGLSITNMFNLDPKKFSLLFPWGKVKSWPFSLTLTGTARAHNCSGSLPAAEKNTACKACRDATIHNDDLKRVAELAKKQQLAPGYRNQHYNLAQMATAKVAAREKQEQLRLVQLTGQRKLAAAASKISLFEQLLHFLAQHDINRVDAILRGCIARAMKREGSTGIVLRDILLQLDRALHGVGRAGCFTEKEYDVALLLLRLGGRGAATVAARSLGLPSVRSIQRHVAESSLGRFHVTYSLSSSTQDMAHNMKLLQLGPWPWSLAMDDVAVTPGLGTVALEPSGVLVVGHSLDVASLDTRFPCYTTADISQAVKSCTAGDPQSKLRVARLAASDVTCLCCWHRPAPRSGAREPSEHWCCPRCRAQVPHGKKAAPSCARGCWACVHLPGSGCC